MNIFKLSMIPLAIALSSAAAAQTTLERLKEENIVRVGVANEKPYGYLQADGTLSGEGPAIARQILSGIDPDLRLEGVVTRFEALIPELQAGGYDIMAAGMFITPQRCQEVAFSNPTYRVGQAFAVQAGNPKGLTDYKTAAQHPDARLGFMAGAVEYIYATEAGLLGADRSKLYPDPQAALEGLRQGEVDAVALSALAIQNLVADAEDLEATAQFFPVIDGKPVRGYGAFAFRKDDQDLVEAFNRRLAEFIGTEQHRQIMERFGFTPAMEPDRTAEELCQG